MTRFVMTRDDFLRELRIALQGRIPQVQVNEQLNYYENYIIEESRKGRTEDEVIASLGSPRLLAKTLIEVYGSGLQQETQDSAAEDGTGGGGFRRCVRKLWAHRWIRGLVLGGAAAFAAVLLIWIGILLLPVLAAFFMVSAILYFVYLIFFGNKK